MVLRWYTLLLVALTTGIRRGEPVSLRWSDIDIETGVLHVRRNVARIDGVGYIEKEPKWKWVGGPLRFKKSYESLLMLSKRLFILIIGV